MLMTEICVSEFYFQRYTKPIIWFEDFDTLLHHKHILCLMMCLFNKVHSTCIFKGIVHMAKNRSMVLSISVKFIYTDMEQLDNHVM